MSKSSQMCAKMHQSVGQNAAKCIKVRYNTSKCAKMQQSTLTRGTGMRRRFRARVGHCTSTVWGNTVLVQWPTLAHNKINQRETPAQRFSGCLIFPLCFAIWGAAHSYTFWCAPLALPQPCLFRRGWTFPIGTVARDGGYHATHIACPVGVRR